MSLRDDLTRWAHELESESDAAFDLWSWLPSCRAAKRHHGGHAGNYRPGVYSVIVEACEYIADGLNPGPEKLRTCTHYQCPCGEEHVAD